MKSRSQQLAWTGAIFAAVTMFLLSIAQTLGVYPGAVSMMEQWHMFYTSTTIGGTIAGMIEAAIITYISVLLVLWIYSLLEPKKK